MEFLGALLAFSWIGFLANGRNGAIVCALAAVALTLVSR